MKTGVVATALAFGLGATAAFADTVTLRMSTWLPPKHHHTAVALPAWIAAVEEASGGTLKIKIDPAPIAKPPGQYEVVRDGAADMAYHVVAYTPGPFQILRGIELPFLSPSAEVGSQAAYEWYDENVGFDKEFDDVKIITMFVHGPGAVHSKEPIQTLEDLAGVKLRVGGGGVRMSEALGATPVAMPASKAYGAVQKGVADGAMFPFESIAGFRLGELANNHLEIPGGFYTTPFAVMMNPAKFDSLSAEHQKVLTEAGGVAGAKIIGAAWDDADAIGRQAAIDMGGVFHTLEGAELERWKERIAFLDAAWVEKADAAGHDGAALLDALAMILLTVPIFCPIVMDLGFDPVWFGVIVVMVVELGLISPPIGMNVFVIKGMVPRVSLSSIYRGVIPFVIAQLVLIVIVLLIPEIILWLPETAKAFR